MTRYRVSAFRTLGARSAVVVTPPNLPAAAERSPRRGGTGAAARAVTLRDVADTASPERPLWRQPAAESHLWTTVSMVAVGLLHLLLPDRLAALRAPEVVGWTIVVLAVVVDVAKRNLPATAARVARGLSIGLLTIVVVTNFVSLGLLVDDIVTGGGLPAAQLLLGGVVVWLTNVAAFGFVFWETDRGGPGARARGTADETVPDLLFPQMTDPRFEKGFRPGFVDYLFVAFTNALAFSPTDTMPLSRWTKALFAVEALISFGTIALVAARAVNILPGQ
jgi:hypothetical protein